MDLLHARKHSLLITASDQLRKARSYLLECAYSHGGRHQQAARQALQGDSTFIDWHRDGLTITRSLVPDAGDDAGLMVTVRYAPPETDDHYQAGVFLWAQESRPPAWWLLAVVYEKPTSWDAPWGNKAGAEAMEKLVRNFESNRAPVAPRSPGVQGLFELMGEHGEVLVLTPDGADHAETLRLARRTTSVPIAQVDAAGQLAIARELPAEQLPKWLNARLALFERHGEDPTVVLAYCTTDDESAKQFLAANLVMEEKMALNGACLEMSRIVAMAGLDSRRYLSQLETSKNEAEDLRRRISDLESQAARNEESDRNEDHIAELELQVEEQRETMKAQSTESDAYRQYFGANGQSERADGTVGDGEELDRSEALALAISDPVRFAHLRFLPNCGAELSAFRKARPTGNQVLDALDKLNQLASDYYGESNGKVGPWANYFSDLPGWTYATGESDTTMSRHGKHRTFMDPEQSQKVSFERHLTCRSGDSGVQVFFAEDDKTKKLVIGYIGPHLRYAGERT